MTNTLFSTTFSHGVSWRHPRSSHWHQLDLVISRRPFSTASSVPAVTTALTVTPTTFYLAARCVFNPNESTAPRRKDAHASPQPGQQSETRVRAPPTSMKRPWGTATQQALKKDGTTSVSLPTNQTWTPSAIESGRTQTDLKLVLPNSSQQLRRSEHHCSRPFD